MNIFHRLFLLLLPLIFSGCISSPFYYPDNVQYDTPQSRGLAFEKVDFLSKDGTRLKGWFIPAVGLSSSKEAKATVIHFHGNAQNMSAHWAFVSWLPQKGFNVFVFDYRGYGASEGSPEPKGVFEDASSAISYVRMRPDVDPERLLIFGQSLGGTNAIAAIGAGNRAGIRAIVIESTFYSYSSIANDKLLGAGFLVSDTYSASNYVAQLAPIPLLLIHGTADTVVPYEHSQRLFATARSPKKLVTMEGGQHLSNLSPQFQNHYQQVLLDFFEAALVPTTFTPIKQE